MPPQDPFGPSIYVPNPTNTGPGSASEGWATGISNLGRALFPDPSVMATAKYHNAQTQLLLDQANARQALSGVLKDPNYAADPTNRAQIFSYIARLPADEQKTWHDNLGPVMGTTNMPGADVDTFVARSGIVPAGNTPTGFNAQLRTQLGVAQTSANATIGAAQIGSDTTKYTHYYTPMGVTSPGDEGQPPAGPAVVPQGQATGQPVPGGRGAVAPGGGNFMPAWQDPGQTSVYTTARPATPPAQTTVRSTVPPASHGNPPGAAATQPQSSTTAPATPLAPTPSQQYGTNLQSGINKNAPATQPKEDIGALIDQHTGDVFGAPSWNPWGGQATGKGDYILGQDLRDAVARRANEYLINPSSKGTYGNPQAAVGRAFQDIIAPIQGQLEKKWHTGIFGSTGETPSVERPPNVPIPTPPPVGPSSASGQMPQPQTPPPQTPMPSTGTSAIPAPPAVQYTAPPKTPTRRGNAAAAPAPARITSLNDVPAAAQKPGLVIQGRVWAGGNASDPNTWREANPADIAKAQKGGMYFP